MPITRINAEDWTAILAIQAEAYSVIEPESLCVLQSKWHCSPDTCFVFRDADRQPLAYLLAHPWDAPKPPSLGVAIPAGIHGDGLYLHDLAVSARARKTGAASRLVKHLICKANRFGYRRIHLMSIQSSQAFWSKQGFVSDVDGQVCGSYGDGASYMTLRLQQGL